MLGAMLAANTSLVSICLGDDALGDAVSVHPCERSFKFNFFLFSDQKLNNDAHVLKECMIAIIKVHYLLCCTKCAWLLLQGIQELVDGIKENSTLQKVDLENKVHIVTLLPLTICAKCFTANDLLLSASKAVFISPTNCHGVQAIIQTWHETSSASLASREITCQRYQHHFFAFSEVFCVPLVPKAQYKVVQCVMLGHRESAAEELQA